MVDRANRDVAAQILRDFIDGKITNDEFMKRFPKCADAALWAVYEFTWRQFSDLRVHTLTGRDSPPPERKAFLERCYIFLTTDLEFEWPAPKRSLVRGLLQILTLGRCFRPSDEEYKSKGDFDFWPFLRKRDYEAHVQNLR